MTLKTTGNEGLSTHTFEEDPLGTLYDAYDDYYWHRTWGTEITGYHKKVRAGELLPVNRYSQLVSQASFSGDRSYSSYTQKTGGNHVRDFYQPEANVNYWSSSVPARQTHFTASNLLSYVNSSTYDRVVTRAAVKLTASTHDTLTFAAELAKTVAMFRGALGRLIGYLTSRNPKDWASIWLEGRYGWRTLIYDMESISEALSRLGNQHGEFYRAISGEQETHDDILVANTNRLGGVQTTTLSLHVDISYRGMATSKLAPPPFGGSVLVTAWELVPFSFVIDWFIDVGLRLQYLSGLFVDEERALGYGLLINASASSTTTTTQTGSSGSRVQLGNHWYQLDGGSASGEFTASLRIREPYTPSLIPTLGFRLDGFKVVDLLSLLMVVLKRRHVRKAKRFIQKLGRKLR